MNITSFTSIDSDRVANLDTSSTAHLTLNAGRPLRDSNASDSDTDRSPSVSVICPSDPKGVGKLGAKANSKSSSKPISTNANGNPTLIGSSTNLSSSSSPDNSHHHHHHHHHRLHSLSHMNDPMNIHGSFSHRMSKHPRFFWSRLTSLEKILILAVFLLACTSILLLVSLIDVVTSRKEPIELRILNPHHHPPAVNSTANNLDEANDYDREHKSNPFCLRPNCVKVAASVIEAIDLTVDPCDDFYMYSCGDWIKSNPLPDGKSNWGTFSKLWQDNQSIMRSVLESGNFTPGSAEEKAKIYYESCLDKNDTVETRGTKPMEDLIESAGGWNFSKSFEPTKWDLQRSLQIYHNQYNRGGLFSWAVGADERNSTRNIIQLDQGGLGLPSRDYYLNDTDKKVVLDAYLMYMVKVAELMGASDAESQMKDVLEFEKKLAEITVPQDQRRDDERMYHKFTLKELNKRSPFLNWTKYFDDAFDYHSRTTISLASDFRLRNNTVDAAESSSRLRPSTSGDPRVSSASLHSSNYLSKRKITEEDSIVIYSPEYFDELSKLVQDYSITSKGKTVLANYMGWSVIQSLIATLPKNFRDASKTLRKALIGSEGIEVSWRYCVADTNQVMGFALGSLFVRRVFQGRSKERAEEMIYSIRDAFKDNLASISWMDERTRSLAREKADHINQMIGFPDFILSPEILNGKYEGLELDENNYFENSIKVNVLSLRENMEKINKPANKTEWEMTPPMVNAYYTPTKNQIVFPAGILQTPFYDLSYPNSLNYGAMGVVMGHELTHAFDDQGREYDKDGNLYQWWFNETLQNFEERVQCFEHQYSSYKVDDTHLNGLQTLGENIADNGGLKAAFRAYEKWATSHPEPRLPGLNLTSKQLFFVGFAQVWCSISTPEALKLQVLNDPHAPAQFRVIGTLSNSHEFAKEFSCPVGSRMNPEKKCIVW